MRARCAEPLLRLRWAQAWALGGALKRAGLQAQRPRAWALGEQLLHPPAVRRPSFSCVFTHHSPLPAAPTPARPRRACLRTRRPPASSKQRSLTCSGTCWQVWAGLLLDGAGHGNRALHILVACFAAETAVCWNRQRAWRSRWLSWPLQELHASCCTPLPGNGPTQTVFPPLPPPVPSCCSRAHHHAQCRAVRAPPRSVPAHR